MAKRFAIQYQVVEAASRKALQQEVNDLLISGWECQGGVFVLHSRVPDGKVVLRFYQAMIWFQEGGQ